MNNLPFNFGKKANCEQGCPNEMNNEHLLNCPELNEDTEKEELNLILIGPNEHNIKFLR